MLSFIAKILGPKLVAFAFGSKARLILTVVTVLAVGGAVGGAWWHYKSLKRGYEQCLTEKGKYETALVTVNASFKAYRDSVEAQIVAMKAQLTELKQKYRQSEERADELGRLLAKHDFVYLAYRKPGLIERRVNSGTARVLKSLEQTSRDFSDRDTASESGGNVPAP